ncbi:MAG: hypothetical protein IIA01_06780 [Proteobacteria bacterium]|nr:hypothetical protein [Pseudomonadota bacterium]
MFRFFKREKGPEQRSPSKATEEKAVLGGSLPLADSVVSVIDVETTGIFARKNDRIIEIAIVRAKAYGEIIDEFETLVNPERDLGPIHVHGITGADIRDAPQFSEIAGDIIERISDSVIVGHNIRFDLGFIRAEFDRLGINLPPIPNLCTLRLGSLLGIQLPSRTLTDCCEYLGVSHRGAHTALGDARATAGLYSVYLITAQAKGVRTLGELGCNEGLPPPQAWPNLPRSGRAYPRCHAAQKQADQEQYISRLVKRLPAGGEQNADGVAYLELLDRVLEDLIITEEEAESLYDLATDWGLSRDQVGTCHRSYLNDLVLTALEDGVVTETERRELESVARALGIENQTLNEMLEDCRGATPEKKTDIVPGPENEFEGMTVCFTGTSRCSIGGQAITKEHASHLAAASGLDVRKNVTKDLDLLVLADPNSMSGKAKKAREYGIRTMSEEVFWRKLGVVVD